MEIDQASLYVPDNTAPETKPCDCSTGSLPATESRNLIVCIDGTSNKFGTKNTNVVELYSHILKKINDNQLTYYDSGIGTFARPSWRSFSYLRQIVNNKIDLAIAWNLEKVILGAYRWISNHYRPGDKIFLFGFSRGAYQVRVLAGMIHAVGLILPGNEAQIPFAFELYSAYNSNIKLAENFKKTFSQESVRIHFLGAWDTVSSVGVLRSKTVPLVVGFCEHICIFRHALALDECRVKFLPEYIHEGASHTPDEILVHGDDITNTEYMYSILRYLFSLGWRPVKGQNPRLVSQTSDKDATPRAEHCTANIKEVWFAGTHADIGGGNRDNTDLQSGDIPLLWMRNEAIQAGLRLKPTNIQWKQEYLEEPPRESLVGLWWLLEYLPLRRLSFDNAKDTTYRLHAGQSRKIVEGQKIHASVIFRPGYRPKAAYPGYPFADWPHQLDLNEPASHQRLKALGESESHWETDLFDLWPVGLLFHESAPPQEHIEHLIERVAFLSSFEEGRNMIPKTDDVERILLELIENDNDGIKINAAITLCELGTVWEGKEKVFSEVITKGCLKTLSRMLCTPDDKTDFNPNTRASNALPSLVKNGSLRSEIIKEHDLVEKLLQLFSSTNRTVRASSTRTVSYLVAYDDLRDHMYELDKHESLWHIWTSSDDAVMMSGATILSELARNNCSRSALVKPNILNQILRLVSPSKSLSVTSAYLKALALLAGYDDTRSAILESNFLDSVGKILSSGDPSVILVTVETLFKLSVNDDKKRDYVNQLMERIQSTDKQTWSSCFNGLKFLANQDDTRDLIIQSKLVIALVSKLAHGKSFLDAAKALNALTFHDGFRQAIIKSSFTEHLVDKLVEGGAPIVSIMKALELFAESEDIRATMIESRIVCVLVTGFAERSLWGTVITVRAIQTSLMKYDDFRQALLQQKLISALVRLVKSGNIFIVLSTAHILVDLGSHVDTRNAVLASDLVKSLVDRLRPWKSFREQISNMELDGDLHDAVKKEYENPKSDDVPGWFYAVVVLNCLGILCFHLVSVVWMMRYG